MRFEKTVTLNMGQYESIRLAVSDAECFEDCDRELIAQASRIDDSVAEKLKKYLAREVK